MSEGWLFYRFDYHRYLLLRPALRSATTAQAFAALSETPETEAVVEALLDEEVPLVMARHTFVRSLCCCGEPLPVTRSLPRVLSRRARSRHGIEAVELLTEVMEGGHNLDPCLLPASEIVGLLRPEEVTTLAHLFEPMLNNSGARGGRNRRGGLFAAVGRFLRLLFDRDPTSEEMLVLLRDLVQLAADRGEGIAVVRIYRTEQSSA